MSGPILLVGGARSGKSALAAGMASARTEPVTFIATAEARDTEMRERIDRHRRARPAGWTTIEEPVELVPAVEGVPLGEVILLDCLTLWASNLLERGCDGEAIADRAGKLAAALSARAIPAIVVTNEVGSGIVPDNALARVFRDALGAVNTIIAAVSSAVFLVAAGRLLPLRRPEEVLGDVFDR